MHSLRFLPEVADDALAAERWYESRAPGLGQEFLRSFYACAHAIAAQPTLFSAVHRDFRRRLLRRFPYAVYYRADADSVKVFGLFHCARDPKRVSEWLGERREE